MFCTINDGVNPWNTVYKIESGKVRKSTRLTTLEKDDATHTTDMKSTITHMPEHVVPEDREGSDNELHKKIRKEIQEPPDTAGDKAFTKDEIIVNSKTLQLEKGSRRGRNNEQHSNGSFTCFSFVFHTIIQCVSKGGMQ